MHENAPKPVRPTQWLAWAALQAWFTPFGIYAYRDMSRPPWNVETNWALGSAAVLIASAPRIMSSEPPTTSPRCDLSAAASSPNTSAPQASPHN